MTVRVSILFFLINLLLTSCCSVNSRFDCPVCAGVMCKSIDQINTMVDSGEIQGQTPCIAAKTSTCPQCEFQPYCFASGFYPGAPLRYGETVQRIWIAPFEDQEQNYHQESYLYSIMEGGHWIGSPCQVPKES